MLRKVQLFELINNYIKQYGEDDVIKPLKNFYESQSSNTSENVFYIHFQQYMKDQLKDENKLKACEHVEYYPIGKQEIIKNDE